MQKKERQMHELRVLIVDDHPLMRDALKTAVGSEPGLYVVGEATNGDEAVEQARALQPDVIIMDLLMPGMDGLEAIAAIHRDLPHIRILAITSSSEEDMVLKAVKAGASGYVLKDVGREDLLTAVREVGRGQGYLPPTVALKLIQSMQRSAQDAPAARTATSRPTSGSGAAKLTKRERQVLALLGQGLSNREIAAELVISEATVRSHIYHILGKLQLENRSQAVV
ncbi:MAG: response regulator transcription factor, partial [Chloroflexi bacterium]|nr:response regulator transcription factor [Chloroflexota bacterium]